MIYKVKLTAHGVKSVYRRVSIDVVHDILNYLQSELIERTQSRSYTIKVYTSNNSLNDEFAISHRNYTYVREILERELARRYATEDTFYVDMTFFERKTLDYCLHLLEQNINDLSQIIAHEFENIESIEVELEENVNKDNVVELRGDITRIRRRMDDIANRRARFIQKKIYVLEISRDLQLSESDTDVDE